MSTLSVSHPKDGHVKAESVSVLGCKLHDKWYVTVECELKWEIECVAG